MPKPLLIIVVIAGMYIAMYIANYLYSWAADKNKTMTHVIIFAIVSFLLLRYAFYPLISKRKNPACDYEYEWLWDDMHYPNSSAIYAYDYDECYQKMVIVFTSNEDVVYIYSDVPKDIYDGFRRSQSKGSYYNKYIKGQYECEKVE